MKKAKIYRPKEINRIEALKKMREAIRTTQIVAHTVGGPTMDGGFGDEWALGFILQLESLGLIKLI